MFCLYGQTQPAYHFSLLLSLHLSLPRSLSLSLSFLSHGPSFTCSLSHPPVFSSPVSLFFSPISLCLGRASMHAEKKAESSEGNEFKNNSAISVFVTSVGIRLKLEACQILTKKFFLSVSNFRLFTLQASVQTF